MRQLQASSGRQLHSGSLRHSQDQIRTDYDGDRAPAPAGNGLRHLPEHGDVVGGDIEGWTVIELAVDDWVLDSDDTRWGSRCNEEDGPPVVVELVRPKVVGRSH